MTTTAWWPEEKFEDASRRPAEPSVSRWHAPVTVTLPAPGSVTVTDVMGYAHRLQPKGGRVRLQLTGSPVYVRGLGGIPNRRVFWQTPH